MHLHLRSEQARPSLHRALIIARDIQANPLSLRAVVGFAWHYQQQGQPVRAGELAGVAQQHPAHDGNVHKWLDEVLPLLQDALSPSDLEAALARGKTLDLDRVVQEILEEFGEDHA